MAGYSSHQGVLRFLQEVDRYQPDLVLVSFGWNDAAEAIGQPDKTFKIPPWPVVVCQRALVRYRDLSRAHVLHAKVASGAARGCAWAGFTACQRDGLSCQHGPISNRGRPQGHRDRLSDPAAQAAAGGTEQECDVARVRAADTTTRLRTWGQANDVPVLDAQHYFEQLPPDLFSDECHFTPQGYERMAKLVREEIVAGEARASPQAEQRQATGESRETPAQR